jgi:hypothetical protein
MTRVNPVLLSALSVFALCTMAPMLPAQSLYNVTVNTTGLNATAGGLAFDFLAGDNITPNNTVVISSFATTGTLASGGNTNQGSAIGSLPGTLTLQDSAFSESFRGLTFGTSLSYSLSLTTNFAAPGAPDEFSFFLTDPTNSSTVVQTNDPTGADALFIVDVDGSGQGVLTVFTPTTTGVSYSVRAAGPASTPEPTSLAFAVAGLLVGRLLLRSRRRG